MNVKRIWFIIPTIILPYLVLFILATVIFSTRVPFFKSVMTDVFQNNVLILLAFILLFVLLAAILSSTCFIISLCKKWDARSMAKTAMIVKLIQIPAYLTIFVLGALFLITIFTYAITIILFLIDCVTLFLSGLLTISSVINASRSQLITKKEALFYIVFQFIFVVDVFATINLFKRLKIKKTAELITN